MKRLFAPSRSIHNICNVSFLAQRCSVSTKNLRLGFFKRVCHAVPHPAKLKTHGEDAFLACDFALGVCDGVSWWQERMPANVTFDLYSEALVRSAYEWMEESWMGDPAPAALEPDGARGNTSLQLLCTAFDRTQPVLREGEGRVKQILALQDADTGKAGSAQGTVADSTPLLVGTTTALFCTMTSQNDIDIVCLGDCVALVIRDGHIIAETTPQQHELATPFQIGTGSSDMPSMAEVITTAAQPGDIVVIGSDGIFDNIYQRDVVKIIRSRYHDVKNREALHTHLGTLLSEKDTPAQQWSGSHDVVQAILRLSPATLDAMTADDRDILSLHVAALRILRAAQLNAFDPKSDTPYSAACVEAGAYFEGGKIDDMTVVIGMVSEDPSAAGQRFSQSSLISAVPYKNWP